jgi:Carboxylesterase family/Major Facilitator Superfamily
VLPGRKRATTPSLWFFELRGLPLPAVVLWARSPLRFVAAFLGDANPSDPLVLSGVSVALGAVAVATTGMAGAEGRPHQSVDRAQDGLVRLHETHGMTASSTNWARTFFTFWTGQALSLFGTQLVQFALVWWLTETTGSATVLATATLVGVLPNVFLAPVAGVLVDRWSRRTIMIASDGAVALATLGYVVPDDPAVLIGTTHQLNVPLLIGHNADESLFWASELPTTVAEYREFVRARFPASVADTVLARYPAATAAGVAVAAPLMNADFQIIAPTILIARAASKVTDVYMYQFSRVAPSTRSTFGGAAHTTEVPYVFDNTNGDVSQFEEVDHSVSRAMADAWVQFASTGNPNGTAPPRWPAYRSPDYRLLDFGDRVTVRSNAQSPQVDFYQRIFDTMRGPSSTSAGLFQQSASPAVNPAQEPPIRTGAAPCPTANCTGPLMLSLTRLTRSPR